MTGLRFVPLIAVLTATLVHADDGSLSEKKVRQAIGQSLKYIREAGQEWREQRQCVSCHRISFQVWSHRAAQRAGVPVDDKAVAEWSDWSVDWKHWPQPERVTDEKTASAGNVETMGQMILARVASPSVAGKSPEWTTRFRDHLLRLQQKDGAWKPNGQLPLQRRPIAETAEVSTMWTVLALRSPGLASKESTAAVDRAAKRLESAKPGISTEWWAARLLVMQELGRKDEAAKARKKLLAMQKPDGGWGWLHAEKSDAFGTGLALYALSRVKSDRPRTAIERGRDFLLKTQFVNGSWAVPSSRKKDKLAVKETSRFWGTTWAVIGLSESLPAAKSPVSAPAQSSKRN